MSKTKVLNGLLKAGIIGVGTLVGMTVAKCLSVEEKSEGEPNEPEEFIDAEYEVMEEVAEE